MKIVSFYLNSALAAMVLLVIGSEYLSAQDKIKVKESEIVIQKERQLKGIPAKTRLDKVWSYNTKISAQFFLEKRFGTKELLYVNITNTSFEILIVRGKVQPILVNSDPHEIWEMNGLQKQFSLIKGVNPTSNSIELVAPGGDMRGFWKIDLTKKLKLSYREEYDGF